MPGGTDSEAHTSGGKKAVAGVGTYEADDAVVFYDTENPLAWVQSRVTVALDEAV
jgi:hypothetical protein